MSDQLIPLISRKLKSHHLAILFLTVLSFIAIPLSAQNNTEQQTGKVFVIGKVGASPKKDIKALQPMANYLAMHMQDLGYNKGSVFIARNKEELVRALQSNKVDLVTETAFSTMYLRKETGSQPILRKWKKGIAEYHAIIFVRKDSGINNLQDLKGKTIAFEDPNSTSAYYLPAYDLLMQGLQLEQLSSPKETPYGESVGYIFSKQEINTSVWVHKGRVDAGAISNLDWDKNENMPTSFHPDLKIIHNTFALPRAIESVRHSLPDEVKERIKLLLLNIDKNEDAYSILQKYHSTRKFDQFDQQTMDSLERVNEVLSIVDQATQ